MVASSSVVNLCGFSVVFQSRLEQTEIFGLIVTD